MPELPEVEIMGRSLLAGVDLPLQLKQVEVTRKDLRFPLPLKKFNLLKEQKLKSLFRKAKYLFLEFETGYLVSHLGMTGVWKKQSQKQTLMKHDHVILEWADGSVWVYNDPRRFGFIEYTENPETYLADYAKDPLEQDFSGEELFKALGSRKAPIKAVLMDQKVVSGVGNIYANEALFRSKIHPMTAAQALSKKQTLCLVRNTQEILLEAIEAGGSSISDFENSEGKQGYFQHHFQVYGQGGNPCQVCKKEILHEPLAGRMTYWCPRCQKL